MKTSAALGNAVLPYVGQVETGSTVDCAGCTACCKNEIVFLVGNEDPDDYPGGDFVGAVPPGNEPAYVLGHKPNGDCIFLGDAGCTIYEKRPMMCRAFSCVGFFERAMAEWSRSERRLAIKHKRFDTEVWKAGKKRSKAKHAKRP